MSEIRGAVACGHPVTAAAAEEILLDGGNAFDAALAAQLAAAVAEPVLTSLAGGGYLLASPAGGAPRVYDFFVDTPRRPRPRDAIDFHPIHADFGTATQEFHIGLGAAATPGVVRGTFAVHADLCSLPMARLTEPAIRAARDGVEVSAFQAYVFGIVAPIYRVTPAAERLLRAGEAGARLLQPALADSLEALAREGERWFYEGDVAQRIAAMCAGGGGHLTRDDLEHYAVRRRAPLSLRYRTHRITTNAPPSSGGPLIATSLRYLEDAPLPEFGGTDHLRRLVDAMRRTNAARARGGVAPAFTRGTTHISVIDGAGNAAAMTLSNGEGCGHVIPDTGIMLNNMLGEEDLNPDGFHRWPSGARMISMMAPTLIENAGTRIALGSGGSNRIRTAIVQVISNLVDHGDDLAAAVRRPRIHFERDRLSIEPGFTAQAIAAMRRAHPDHHLWDAPNLFFGGVHAVADDLDRGRFQAAGDPRRGGVGRIVG